MKVYSRIFTEYLGTLETKTNCASQKETDATAAAALKKAGLKRRNSGKRKVGRILLIAAAVSACAAVTAAAAGINVGTLFRGCFTAFNPISNHSETAGLTQGQTEMLNKTGAAINQSVTSNGTTVTITAAAGDKHNAFFLMEVNLPNGKKLSCRDFSDLWFGSANDAFPVLEADGHRGAWNSCVQVVSKRCSASKIVYLWEYSSNCADLQGQEVKLSLKDLRDEFQNRVIATGNWAFDFKMNYGDSETKTVRVDKIIQYQSTHKSNQNTTVQCTAGTVKLSAMSASADFTGDNLYDADKIKQIPNWLTIHLKDGKDLYLHSGNGTGNSKKLTVFYLSNEPIDLGSVVSVTIGDATVPVS